MQDAADAVVTANGNRHDDGPRDLSQAVWMYRRRTRLEVREDVPVVPKLVLLADAECTTVSTVVEGGAGIIVRATVLGMSALVLALLLLGDGAVVMMSLRGLI